MNKFIQGILKEEIYLKGGNLCDIFGTIGDVRGHIKVMDVK